MIVGTCARSPAPATSPIGLPSFRCVHGVLHVAVEVEAPGAALPADPGVPGPAERRAQVADEEAKAAPDATRRPPIQCRVSTSTPATCAVLMTSAAPSRRPR